jgi:SAM-dependent methyltransferase
MILPHSAYRYLLLQRTELQKLNFKWLKKMGVHYFPRLCEMEIALRSSSISRSYTNSIAADYTEIKSFLPENAKKILDIGCGVAGIDVYLNQHFQQEKPDIFLLDKTALNDQIYYDFHQAAAFYNSLQVASEVLRLNEVAQEKIHLLEANEECRIPVDETFDLVVSFISWGFHYPVRTYVQEVHRVLRSGALAILDVRNDTTGMADLHSVFGNIKIISQKPKYARVAAYK